MLQLRHMGQQRIASLLAPPSLQGSRYVVPDTSEVGAKERLTAKIPPRLEPLARTGYRTATGRQFRAWIELRQRMTARDPRTLTDHIRHKMAHDRRPILTTFADKIAVREHVAGVVGARHLSTVHAVTRDPGLLDWTGVPREFVCKASHGSGGAVLVWDGADPGARLPEGTSTVGWQRYVVRPEAADSERIVDLSRRWMSLEYDWWPGKPVVEWAYQDIPPGILVEELLLDADGCLPTDYKFFTFAGQVRLISVDRGRFGAHTRDVMSPGWDRLPVRLGKPPSATPPERPRNLGLMLELAAALGRAAVDFVRVDLYDLGDRVVFGELTNYPDAGQAKISPSSFDAEWGRYWPSAPSGREDAVVGVR